jgi:Mg2+-importing ATPase
MHIPFSNVGRILEMTVLPLNFFGIVALIVVMYFALVQIVKKLYIRKYGNWL